MRTSSLNSSLFRQFPFSHLILLYSLSLDNRFIHTILHTDINYLFHINIYYLTLTSWLYWWNFFSKKKSISIVNFLQPYFNFKMISMRNNYILFLDFSLCSTYLYHFYLFIYLTMYILFMCPFSYYYFIALFNYFYNLICLFDNAFSTYY